MIFNKIFYLQFIIILIFTFSPFSQYNSLRIAQSPGGTWDIPPNFLDRAVAAGYNYIYFQIPLGDGSEWSEDTATLGTYLGYTVAGRDTLLVKIKNAFINVHNYAVQNRVDLKLIPDIKAGSKHSASLGCTHLPIKWAPLMKTKLDARLRNMAQGTQLQEVVQFGSWCPSFAPDSEGYDKAFQNVVGVIATAFHQAKTDPATQEPASFPDELDYIHLGSDEQYTVDIIPVDYEYQFFPGLSQYDKQWIWYNVPKHGGLSGSPDFIFGRPCPRAKQMLLANELSRRIDDVHNAEVYNSTDKPFRNTKLLFYCDAWDPQKNGEYFGISGAYPDGSIGVINELDAIDPVLKNSVIFCLWQYDDTKRNLTNILIDNVDFHLIGPKITGDMLIDATGSRYSPFDALNYFCSKNCNVMFCFALARPGKSSMEISEKVIQVFKIVEDVKIRLPLSYKNRFIGYSSFTWEPYETWNSGATNIYDQYFRYNVLELVAKSLDENIPDFPKNSTHFGSMVYVTGNSTVPSFICDETETKKLDYLVLNKNYLYADIDRADLIKKPTFVDAIIYCNNLSVREGLVPVYSYDLRIGDNVQDISIGIADELESLTADFTKNGYRLLTIFEMQLALNSNLLDFSVDNGGEWVWVPNATNPTIPLKSGGNYGWVSYRDGTFELFPHNQNKYCFRVCRNASTAAPLSILITGSGDDLRKSAFAKNLITIQNANFFSPDRGFYISGGEIRILPETHIRQGCEVRMFIDELLH